MMIPNFVAVPVKETPLATLKLKKKLIHHGFAFLTLWRCPQLLGILGEFDFGWALPKTNELKEEIASCPIHLPFH